MGGKLTKDGPAPHRGLASWRQGLHRDQQPIEEDWRYRAGCIKNDGCPYGRAFEPDLRIINPALIRRQDDQGVRGLSIATDIVQPDSQGFGQPLW